jgi:zinc protease
MRRAARPAASAPAEVRRRSPCRPRSGRHTVLVDKPERTQTADPARHTAPPRAHADWLALSVGSAVFGGTFTSRLMSEVRVKRGWSYGASSSRRPRPPRRARSACASSPPTS